jgi:hypothetical protein
MIVSVKIIMTYGVSPDVTMIAYNTCSGFSDMHLNMWYILH